MKKFTNVRSKIMFSSSSSNTTATTRGGGNDSAAANTNNDSGTSTTTTSSAAAAAAANIRAEYYASRGGVSSVGGGGGGGARNNANPFDNDDDDDDNDAIPSSSRPATANNYSSNSTNNNNNNNNSFDSPRKHQHHASQNDNRHNPNPFDDDDDDDEEEEVDGRNNGGGGVGRGGGIGENNIVDPLAMFARKKKSTYATSTAGVRNPNPFDDDDEEDEVVEPKDTSGKRTNQNPFDDDDDDDDDDDEDDNNGSRVKKGMSHLMPPSHQYRPPVGSASSAASAAAAGGGGSRGGGSRPPSAGSNSSSGGGARRPSSAGSGGAGGGSGSTNPFAEDDSVVVDSARGKPTTTSSKSNNPFGGDDDDDDDGNNNGGDGRRAIQRGGEPRRQSTPVMSTRPTPPAPPSTRRTTNSITNPFDDDTTTTRNARGQVKNDGLLPPPPPRALLSQVVPEQQQQQQQQQQQPQQQQRLPPTRSTPPLSSLSSGNNPFGNDTTPRSSITPATTTTTASTITTPLTSRPLSSTTTTTSGSGGGGIRNTPFGKETPRPSTGPTMSTPSATSSATTNQPLRPASATTPGLLLPPTAKKRWSNAITSITGGIGGGVVDPSSSTRPLISAMDEESVAAGVATAAAAGGTSNNAAGLASWLRMNKKDDEGIDGSGDIGKSHPHTTILPTDNGKPSSYSPHKTKKLKAKKKCRAYVTTPWPFDNYHEVQEQLYEELASRAASEYSVYDTPSRYNDNKIDDRSSRNKAQGGGGGIVGGGKANNNRRGGGSGRTGGGMHGASGGSNMARSKYYERPEELPSIKEAVNDLPLVDFEKKAQERAVNIVSTWLFDAGLIDELLVNGATGPQQQQQQSQHSQHLQQQLHYAMKMRHSQSSGASVMSEKTSEGQELGAHGFLVNVEGAELKMDKETNKLRAMIQRDLSIINARLNDGVAASGLEVQELVNSVAAAKDDIGRLRELTTYISDGQTFASNRDEFLLAKYPYLRKAINARRNINRFFRELEFFSHIPSTCERLRDDLHGGEWTDEEWSTIRNVSMEHVELEVMLVEAEDSMKGGAHNFNDATVDNFLEAHVQNVWELGDEIRMRIISGIGSAFELSMNNPAGMVALVEAVEVYERAAETFEKKRSGNNARGNRLRFTNMRAAALEQLYQDFELRGVDMFRGVHEHAADLADEDDAANTQFTAVLKAATELVTEIDIVKHQMSPCFAPHWHVEALWSSCVAHVCSNHIIQQIGGPEGQNLPDLTITQLLELVAWVEYFRETIEETFPEVASMRNTKKTYFEERPELFDGDRRTVNMQNAWESLAWANNMLWEVHRLAQEEFLVRTRTQTDEWLDKVYGSEAVKNQSAEGKLTTSLCEDVFSFSSVQLRTIRERLSKKSDALILAVCIILSHMRSKQVHSRNIFLQDLETCCAASNDFTRMSEKCEDMISELMSQCQFSEDMIATLEASSNELMGVYSSDAVYSARSVHIYVFDPIEEEIGVRLFEEEWEETMVDNDLAISLVRTLEDFHEDLEHYMDDFMVVKSMMSLMSASVIFYAKCLLQRAEKHRNNKRPYFNDVKRALDRMTGDIKVMREYFESLVVKMPSLKKNIEKDFEILATIHELMSVAAGFSESGAEDFILVLQKRVRDVGITKHIVGDLWHLVAPTEERYVWELVESMEEQLTAIAPFDDALALEVNDRSYVKGLRLDEMAVKLYVKSRRNRPIKATAVESIVKNWGKTWLGSEYAVNEEEV